MLYIEHQSTISEKLLKVLGNRPNNVERNILRLSQLYHEKSTQLLAIWQDNGLREAYLNYFLHINIYRLVTVLDEAIKLGFLAGLDSVIDLGSGPGTFSFSALDKGLEFKNWLFIEQSTTAINIHKNLLQKLNVVLPQSLWSQRLERTINPSTLAVLSYSLNELTELPVLVNKCEAIMIIEPSTQVDSRNLQKLRAKLITQGFYIWAPCTHHMDCPLLVHSKTDWCHHRVHTKLPAQLLDLENKLPMKNKTLTYSYLLARKTPPPPRPTVRVIGDTLFERGKVKQAVCRSDKREFLSWLTKHGEPNPIARGSLINIPEGTLLKGDEIRMPPSR